MEKREGSDSNQLGTSDRWEGLLEPIVCVSDSRSKILAFTDQVQILYLVFHPPFLALPCLGVPDSNTSQQVFWRVVRLILVFPFILVLPRDS